MPFRVADRVRIGSVSDDERDPLPDDGVLEQRLEMASAIRAEDGDPNIGRGAVLIRLRSVYRHRPGSCTRRRSVRSLSDVGSGADSLLMELYLFASNLLPKVGLSASPARPRLPLSSLPQDGP